MYVAHNAPHWPLQALPEDIERYKDTYKAGWKSIRESRYRRMVEKGLLAPGTTLSASYELNWESNPHKEWDARAMTVHAAMVDRMDQGIGRIINELKRTGELDNTLIFFLSDNGASPEPANTFDPGFDRPGETRDGRKIIYPKNKEVLPGPQTVYGAIGKEWASVSNTPFRYWKRESYEGGVRTPLIAFWPKGIQAQKNSISNQVGHVMDFMATFTEIAAAKYPAKYEGRNITPMQGVSLLPALKDRKNNGHDILFNQHASGRSVRAGDWKLVSLKPDVPWELYNLRSDATEQRNIASMYPEKVRYLDKLWQEWAVKNKVFPKPGQ